MSSAASGGVIAVSRRYPPSVSRSKRAVSSPEKFCCPVMRLPSRTALRLFPALPGAHFELAEQLRTSPDPELNKLAENEYKAALQVNPYDEFSWREWGGIMTAHGDFKAAEEDYGKALGLQPKDSDARTGLAIALISMGNRTAEAIALLETAVKDDPTNIVAHFRLSGLYLSLIHI